MDYVVDKNRSKNTYNHFDDFIFEPEFMFV